jgi:hypothetical protein
VQKSLDVGFNSRCRRLIKTSIGRYLLVKTHNKVRDIVSEDCHSLTVVNDCRSRACLLIGAYTRVSI